MCRYFHEPKVKKNTKSVMPGHMQECNDTMFTGKNGKNSSLVS